MRREGRVVGSSGGGELLLLIEVLALTALERKLLPGGRRRRREARDIHEAETIVSGEGMERARVRVLDGE